MYATIRLLLLFGVLLVSAALVLTHGTRGFLFLIALALLATLPQTRAWKVSERWLVRLTGSRKRAAALVLVVLIAGLAIVNLYGLVS